jgi:hypothetical protein
MIEKHEIFYIKKIMDQIYNKYSTMKHVIENQYLQRELDDKNKHMIAMDNLYQLLIKEKDEHLKEKDEHLKEKYEHLKEKMNI